MATGLKYIGMSIPYSYVTHLRDSSGKDRWMGKRWKNGKHFDTEREAALYVDKQLIEQGKEPINILVRKYN